MGARQGGGPPTKPLGHSLCCTRVALHPVVGLCTRERGEGSNGRRAGRRSLQGQLKSQELASTDPCRPCSRAYTLRLRLWAWRSAWQNAPAGARTPDSGLAREA